MGLVKLSQEHEGGLPTFRVILIKPDEMILYSTEAEREKKRADQLEKENQELKDLLQSSKK